MQRVAGDELVVEREEVVEHVTQLRGACESGAPPAPTGHLLNLHRLLRVGAHVGAALGEVTQRGLGRVLHALPQQQAGDDHAGASLAALAVHGDHVGGVLQQPRVALVHDGRQLLYASRRTYAATQRAGVVVLNAVMRVAPAEALERRLRIGALRAEVQPTGDRRARAYTQ